MFYFVLILKAECKQKDLGGFLPVFLLSPRDKVQNRAKLKETLARQICLLANLRMFKLPTFWTYLNLMSSARSLSSCGMAEKTIH